MVQRKRVSKEAMIRFHIKRVEREEPVYDYLGTFDTGMNEEELEDELKVVRDTMESMGRKIYLYEETDFSDHIYVRNQKLRELKKARNKWVFYLQRGKTDKIPQIKEKIKNLYGEVEQCENAIIQLCRENEVNPSGFLRLNEVPKPQ